MAGQTYSKKMIIGGVLLLGIGIAVYVVSSLQKEPEAVVDAVPVIEEVPQQAALPAPSAPQPETVAEPEPEAEPTHRPPNIDIARVDPDGSALIAGQAFQKGHMYLQIDGARIDIAPTPVLAGAQFVILDNLGFSDDPQVLRLDLELDDGTALLSDQQIFLPARPEPKPAPEPEPEPQAVAEAAPQDVPEANVEDTTAVAEAQPVQTIDPAPEEAAEPEIAEPETAAQQPTILADTDGTVKVLGPKVDTVALDTIQYDLQGEVALGGRAAGSGFVRVYLDNTPVTTSKIAPDGAWSMTLPEVDTGVYTLRVDELDAAGAVTSRVETPFKRESPATLAEFSAPGSAYAIKEMTVQPGTTLWAMAVAKYGDGSQFMKVFAANKDRIKDPNLVYPGQIFDLPD
ncbi:MAG: LysM peptidoglycan-binding domain-containing protein [Planktomarina sp.]